MALTDAKDLPARRLPFRLPVRLQAWLASEHGVAQRIAGTAFVIRILSAGIVFGSQILLARWMGGFEFGIYVYVWTWLLLVGDLIHLGLQITAQRHIPEYTRQNNLDLLRGFLTGCRWLTFGTATTVAVVGAAVVHLIERSLDSNVILPLYLACVALPFYAISAISDGIARSYNWIGLALAPHALLRPVALIAVMAGMYFAGLPINATSTMIALAGVIWATALIQHLTLQRRLAHTVPAGSRRYDLRGWLATSLPVITVWGFYTLLGCTDVLVLQQFRPPDEVASYYAVAKILALVAFIYYSVVASAAHRFTSYHVAGDRQGLADVVASSGRWIFWPSLLMTLLILAFGRQLLWLFGPGFVDAYPVMFVLAFGLIARASIGPGERLLNMAGQQRVCALAYAAAFAVNLTGCLLLAGPYGGMGVATATAAAFVVESALLAAIAKRRLGINLFVWRPRRGAASA